MRRNADKTRVRTAIRTCRHEGDGIHPGQGKRSRKNRINCRRSGNQAGRSQPLIAKWSDSTHTDRATYATTRPTCNDTRYGAGWQNRCRGEGRGAAFAIGQVTAGDRIIVSTRGGRTIDYKGRAVTHLRCRLPNHRYITRPAGGCQAHCIAFTGGEVGATRNGGRFGEGQHRQVEGG